MIEFHNGSFYAYDATARRFVARESLTIDDTRVLAIGGSVAGRGATRIDVDGAAVVPAFIDCHVHLADVGYHAGERSLDQVRTYDAYDAAVARIPREDGRVYAGQYDDALWSDGRAADAAPLERYHADALAMLVRVDGHSVLVNRKTLGWLDLPPDIEGIERDERGAPTGRLFTEANWKALAMFVGSFPPGVVRAAERRAAQVALDNGIATVHAQLLGRDADGYAEDLAFLATLPIVVHPKICEPDAGLAARFGLRYVGGDVFLDGSIGSCTAAVREPFEGTHNYGALRFTDDDVYAYFSGAEERGISAGVHAIGDAAIDQCIRTWRRVLGGTPSARGTRHFIEHFEIPHDDHIEACAAMGIHLSMQPQFQAVWGGDGGMYDRRLGVARRKRMNPLRSALERGAVLCGGSDAPVCRFDALDGMRCATERQEDGETLSAHDALAAYTVNAARLAFEEATCGNLLPGYEATFVFLDRDPIASESFRDVRVTQTWRLGERVR